MVECSENVGGEMRGVSILLKRSWLSLYYVSKIGCTSKISVVPLRLLRGNATARLNRAMGVIVNRMAVSAFRMKTAKGRRSWKLVRLKLKRQKASGRGNSGREAIGLFFKLQLLRSHYDVRVLEIATV